MISLLAADLVLLSVERRVCGRVRRHLGLSASQHLLRRDESDGAVQRDLAKSHILARRHGRLIPASWDPRLIGPALAPDHAQFIFPVQLSYCDCGTASAKPGVGVSSTARESCGH